MAEQPPRVPAGEGAGEQERPEVSPEILNFEKYGGLYGRFFLTSVSGVDIVSLIDPAKNEAILGLNFKNLTEDNLKERNYNPVFEKFSLNERKEEWKGVEYSEAYSQWRTKFTDFMINIQDPQREKALRVILSNEKNAKAFTADDADSLFEDFCGGKSDINNFIKHVTANLASSGGKIDPGDLHELLPHLQWIASGLFGKETASSIVTRLIELESALQNDFRQVMNIFDSNKKRISAPRDEEKKILGDLYKTLVPQEKPTPTQQIPTISDVPKPAPVPGELEVDEKDEEEDQPPPPPTSPAEKTSGEGEGLSNAQWQPDNPVVPEAKAGEEEPIPGFVVSQTEGNFFRIKINGKDTGLKWHHDDDKAPYTARIDEYRLVEPGKFPESIHFPEGTGFYLESKDHGVFFMRGGAGIEIPLSEGTFVSIDLLDRLDQFSASLYDSIEPGKARRYDGIEISLADLKNILNPQAPSESDLAPAPPAKPSPTGKIINMEDVEPDDLYRDLNEFLTQNKNESYITLTLSPDQLKEYMIAFLPEGYRVQTGTIEVDKPNNQIIIRNVRIRKSLGRVEFDLEISNSVNGIAAHIRDYDANVAAKMFGGNVKDSIIDIDLVVKEYLNKMRSSENSSWSAQNIYIADGKVTVEFEKAIPEPPPGSRSRGFFQ